MAQFYRAVWLWIGISFHGAVFGAIPVYINLSEQWRPYNEEVKQILAQSLAQLESVKVAPTITQANGVSLEEVLKLSSLQNQSQIIYIELVDKAEGEDGWLSKADQKTHFSIKLVTRRTGSIDYHFKQVLSETEPKTLFADMESQLTQQLKLSLGEVGTVAKKESEIIYFDLGEAKRVKNGGIYRTYRQGEQLLNADGEVFGWLEDTTGIVQVVDTKVTYSTAQTILGRHAIEEGDYITLAQKQSVEDYQGKIISVHENRVAINLGANVGVSEGAFYAVFKNIRTIKGDKAFKEKLGEIKIHTVHDDFAVGELYLSNHYNLSKAVIQIGDPVEEVTPEAANLLSIGFLGTNALDDNSAGGAFMFGYYMQSYAISSMQYRFKAGYGDAFIASGGVMASINNSPSFHYGIDAVYLDGFGGNVFISVDIPTPLKGLKLNMETGYMAGVGEKYEGVNLSISAKFPLESLMFW